MKEEKDLERLYRERFKDFEARPEKDLWPFIEARLNAGKKRTPAALTWKRLGAAAAILAFGYFGIRSFDTTPKMEALPENPVSIAPNKPGTTPAANVLKEEDPNRINAVIDQQSTKNSKPDSQNVTRNQESGNLATYHTQSATKSGQIITTDEPFHRTNTATTTWQLSTSPLYLTKQNPQGVALLQSSYTAPQKERSLFEAIEDSAEEELKTTKPGDKWSLHPAIAPVYYGSLKSNSSPLASSLNSHDKSGETHLSYGLNIAYQINKKFSLRTGVNRVTQGYTTNNISFSPAAEAVANTGNIDFKDNNLNIILNDLGRRPQNAVLTDVPKAGLIYNGDMAQRMGYMEIPLEFKYHMTGSKLGVHLIGGMSSLFLIENSIVLQSDDMNTELGKANNLNSLNFSTNFGVGLDYRFTNDFLFNLEPMFKYQWNTFSEGDNGFSPYLLGIYTGFSFRF